jgi:NAD(P)-dependent dehydrogenase (short-subunit alcohol dehydrogenase family)
LEDDVVALKEGVAIVTGAGSGMGRGVAMRFAALGTSVVAVGRSRANTEETVALIRDAGGKATACIADVSLEPDVKRMVAATLDTYGRLDFAANVAGVAAMPKPLTEMSLEEFEDDHGVNSRGVFLGMKYQIPAMLESGGGAIVNVTSGAAIGGLAYFSAYTAAKHAALGLTRVAALEYAEQGIRVNSVAPGAIATPMLMRNDDDVLAPMRLSIPMKRFGTEDEIAAATIWLCSDESSYITGQILPVEGGYTASAITIVSADQLIADGRAYAEQKD